MDNLSVIGHTELVDMPKYGIFGVPAKTDTGADSSAVWASEIYEDKHGLHFKLFGLSSEFYTGDNVTILSKDYKEQVVINSFGIREKRFKVKLSVVVNGRKVKASFTLANRENNRYPILLGRRLLNNKFVVDVRKKAVDLKAEKNKKEA